MKQERLRKMIKTMYLLRSILTKKNENDYVFKFSSKSKMIRDIDKIIHLGLEEFYSLRIN